MSKKDILKNECARYLADPSPSLIADTSVEKFAKKKASLDPIVQVVEEAELDGMTLNL